MSGASKHNIDFSNVKEGGSFSKKHLPAGDYLARVIKVSDEMPKDKSDKTPMWLFTIQLVDTPSATYPYYCKLQDNQLWKVRNLLVAAGINVPKKKVGVDPNKLVGKTIAVSLDDTEYNDKMQSEVTAVFSPSELSGSASAAADDDDDDVDVADDEDVAETEVEEEGEAEEAEEEADEEADEAEPAYAEDRAGLKAYIKAKSLEVTVKKSMSDDDIRAAIKAAEEAASGDEEEDDEIDLEDLD